MSNIFKILKSILVGIGAVLPGVSGGMIAAAFNIYKPIIEALDSITKTPIKAIKSIWQYIIGVGIGIIIGLLILSLIFKHVPIESTLLFIGLILGGIPEILFYCKSKKIGIKGYIVFFIAVILMIGVLFLDQTGFSNNSTGNFILWIIIGFLIALSFIVPGISGTMILMVLGVYIFLVDTVKEVFKSLIHFQFDWNLIFEVCLPVLIGFVIAVIVCSKLVALLLRKAPQYFYLFTLGIIFVSPINIMYSLNKEIDQDIFDFNSTWYSWLIGLVLFIIGIFVARWFAKKGAQDETKENQGD